MQRLLATEFERHGWTYDLNTVPAILDEVERTGTVEPHRLAANVPTEYIERVQATRADLVDAITSAIGGRALATETRNTLTIHDNRYSIKFDAGAHISGSTLNTGSQISIQGDSPSEDILDAIATLVSAGLGGEWNVEAADDLAEMVAGRADITPEEIQRRTLAAAAGADASQVKELLREIASGTISGVLGTWIVAALGSLT
ncbi:MAG TPA: hypothetical protein VHT29_07460 [Solirubrobacteraceae bacterium]|jgi:hypothetical protein|nr:hypothetical protein [Solirubrobacteraceae bacterium]